MSEYIKRDKAMSRYIDQDKVIDAVLELDTTHRVSWRDAVVDMIDAMPTEDVQPVRWIPCSERLPKTHETGNSFSGIYMQSSPVLVYGVPEYEEEYGFHVVTYCDDKNGRTYWSTELDAVTINEVYAWLPLPEPYQEGEEEE